MDKTVLFWNCQGLRGKLVELYNLITKRDFDLVFLYETFLKHHVNIPILNNYDYIRMDRNERPMGGLLIMIKKNIKYDIIKSLNTKLIESIGINIYNESSIPISLINAYLPGGSKHNDIVNHFANDITELTNFNNPFFIFADLNSRHKQWTNSTNKAGSILYDLQFTNQFFVVHTDENTYCPINKNVNGSIIDLILTNNLLPYDQPTVIQDFDSDHIPVEFNFYSHLQNSLNKSNKNYINANWDKFRNIISTQLSLPNKSPNELTSNEIDRMIDLFETTLNKASQLSIPNVKNNSKEFELPDYIKHLIKLRNYFRRNWSRHHYLPFKTEIISLNKTIKYEISKFRQTIWISRLSHIKPNSSNVYKLTKLFKPKSNSNNVIIVNNKTINSKSEQCQLFADHFFTIYNNNLKGHLPKFTQKINSQINDIISQPLFLVTTEYIALHETSKKIRSLKNNKSPGFDDITNRLIKNIPFVAIKYLTCIYNSCLSTSYFPKAWKHAKVIAIPKAGKDKKNIQNYRPISLLSSASKIFEALIADRINDFIFDKDIIPNVQFGFRKQHSPDHQLFRLFKEINFNLRNKKSTGLLSFDIEKAFDSVWHEGLIHKLDKFNIPIHITKLIHSFLNERTFSVSSGQFSSNALHAPFGLPQGSSLSPLLYNIYTSDVPLSGSCGLAMFADDTAIFCASRFYKHIEKNLKKYANELIKYFHKWKIKINNDKTTAIFFTNRRKKQLSQNHILINKVCIPYSKEIKYLGISFDNKLKLNPHFIKLVSKLNFITRLYYPLINRRSFLSNPNKALLFKTLFQPVMLYGSAILKNAPKYLIKKLQVKQNKLLKMFLNLPWDTRTATVHSLANVGFIKDKICERSSKFLEKCRTVDNDLIINLPT